MCLLCKYNKPNVAMGDIVCYKWMKKTKWIDMLLTKRRYQSPIYGKFKWKVNEEYYQPINEKEIKHDPLLGTYFLCVGFHSLSRKNYFPRHIFPSHYYYELVQVECVIPKGTRYFRSEDGKEIISERLKIVREIQRNEE